MRKQDKGAGRPARQGNGFRWARVLAGMGQLALYLSLLACLWVVLVAIGLALFRENKKDCLVNIYKTMD